MPTIQLLPLLSYVLISSFTPGPSNISTSSLAVLFDFRRTLRYQAGLAVGVGLMMLAGGLVSASLLRWLPAIEPALRLAGAAYILYLAYGLLRTSYAAGGRRQAQPLGFKHGLLLNLSNIKLVVYAFTVFSTFLAPIASNAAVLLLAAALLAAVSACATTTWALFGAGIQSRLHNPRATRWLDAALALFLVYAAIDLSGLFSGVRF
ncbi:MAG: LysE family transporter [Anaerolineales bacterium]